MQTQINNELISPRSWTTGESAGSGMFEELMRSVESHIQKQHDKGTITERNFDQIYLGALQYTLSESAQFVLKFQQVNQQNKMIDAQIIGQDFDNKYKQAQIVHMEKQQLLLDEQIKLAQKELLQADQNLINSVKQGLILDKQVEQADADIELKLKQTLQIVEQTKLVIQQTANALTENTTMVKQQNKLDSEMAILNQKLITEVAQTSDVFDGKPIEGITGKQGLLYSRQADGYLRDAEQKAAKFYTDMMNTRVGSDEDTYDLTTAKMQNDQVAEILDVVRAGVGLTAA